MGCWLLACFFEPALAQIRIVTPSSLAREFPQTHGIVYGTTATFGAPNYGERVFGKLLYTESRGQRHCTADDYDLPDPPASTAHSAQGQAMYDSERTMDLVNIVLVRRGACTFVTKVRVAQEKNAHAVIIVDREDSSQTSEDIQHIVMADDGFGDMVKIPSIMISNYDGQKLINAVKREEVVLQLAWDIPRGEVVVADFWMSSASGESSEFLERFKDSAEVLRYHLQFVPRYHIFSMPKGVDSAGLCIDDNAFCAPDPDGPGPITGADVVEEDVRQLCIWETTATSDPRVTGGANYSQEFWEYVVKFFHQCPLYGKQEYGFTASCATRVMAQIPGISSAKVERCQMTRSHAFLKEQVEQVAWSPLALRVNGWRYSGPLDPEMVLKAVCAGYVVRPPECDELLKGFNIRWVFIRGLSFSAFTWSIILACVTIATGFYLYRRYVAKAMRTSIREEVMLEVQSQMADYLPLQEDGGNGHRRAPLAF